jgi:hypothetical protein
MGKFSDAWNAGEAEKQAAAEADRLEQEVARQAQQRGAAEANRWFDDVLTPVMMEAKVELASQHVQMQINKVPDDHLILGVYSMSGNGKVVSGTIQVWSNGLITFGNTQSLTTTEGAVSSTTRGDVETWLLGIIEEMARQ